MNIVTHKPILLPKNADMSKWAVIACDQYTTDLDYWKKVETYVGDSVSTLRLIFPEIYLKDHDSEERIASINRCMAEYLNAGILEEKDCYVLTERTIADGRKRLGLVVSVDLEEYDYKKKEKIRPTEETIENRLPIRIHIRENALLELPHILLLLDDKDRRVIAPLYQKRENFSVLYDFDLYPNGGHVRGYEIPPEQLDLGLFDELLSPALQKEKYGKDADILFAVGDGNHSMAAAKLNWENIKSTLSEEERQNHPARFALVELINVYDPALDFLPIYRNVRTENAETFVDRMERALRDHCGKEHSTLPVITEKGIRNLTCPIFAEDTIIAVQHFLEKEKEHNGIEIEYVHEKKKVLEDGRKPNGVGILLPAFPKEKLFSYVVKHGKLPKKAFSMGEEKNKKYYIEAKRIK